LKSISNKTKLAIVSVLALAAALPAIGQETPESLLPPGFGDPAAPPPPPPPPVTSSPSPQAPTSAQPSSPRPSGTSASSSTSSSSSEDDEESDEEGEEEEEFRIVFDVPPAGRRSLSLVGVIPAPAGGFPVDAFGDADGEYLRTVIKLTEGPLVSRWGTILTRRFLASRTTTPNGVNGADWAAERAWLLMRMGDAVVARQLVQQVDADSYTPRLYEVAMPVFLANADLSGMCPLAPSAFNKVKDPTWKMARPICSSLAGEQGTATAQLNQARSGRWTRGVDYLLSEKAVGAGTNGRRSVKVEWDKVKGFNAWRFGLAYATGIEPPSSLMADVGAQVDGWRARLPMININSRMDAAPTAAELGVLSNSAFVDIYAKAADDPETNEANKALAEQLGSAYAGSSDSGKVAAMAAIWDSTGGNAASKRSLHSTYVLTARAAALIAPSKDYGDDASRLVASMMTAGLDTNATAWAQVLENDSLGWGILAVGAPGMQGLVSYGQLDDFYDNDQSADVQKSKLLLAGLAGLGRLDAKAQQDFAEKVEVNIAPQTKWARAISSAADRGEAGTVVLLCAVALQGPGEGSGWAKIPAYHLYYITRALKQVGLEADARMIAAEAVTLG
jgi:hypothetical protein